MYIVKVFVIIDISNSFAEPNNEEMSSSDEPWRYRIDVK
jgi:hypothetical protein